MNVRSGAILVILLLTSCATETTVLENRTKLLEGQVRIIDSVTAKNDKQIDTVRAEAVKASDEAQDALKKAAIHEEALKNVLGKVTEVGASLLPGGAILATIAREIDSSSKETLGNAKLEDAKVADKAREDLDKMRADVVQRFETLSDDTKKKLSEGVTQEKVNDLIKVASLGSREEFDRQLQSKFALSESQINELKGWTPEEIIAMLTGLLGGAAGGTAGGRWLSKSGQRIDTTNQKVEDLRAQVAAMGFVKDSATVTGAREVRIDANVKIDKDSIQSRATPSAE